MTDRERGEGMEPSEYKDCTVDELRRLVTNEYGMALLPDKALDEVYPGIYIGEASSAANRFILNNERITHVLNVAKGVGAEYVDSDPELYEKLGIRWLAIEASDSEEFPICEIFDTTSEFIEEALAAGGRVLVHCKEGVSRAAAVVLAFLIERRHLPVREALRQVHARRKVYPNDGFLRQLCELDRKLALRRTNLQPDAE